MNLTEIAKELRRNMTEAERVLWQRLKAKQLEGFKFRRQEQIGRFIVDFVCFETGVVIEADGGRHSLEKEKDEERTQWLNLQGYTVLRFWNNDILNNIDAVMEAIGLACRTPTFSPLPSPLPQRGEGAKS